MALYPDSIADHNYLPNDREGLTQPTLFNHMKDHDRLAEEVVAIERELGLNPAADYFSVAERLDDFEDRIYLLETEQVGQYVIKSGDVMSGSLTLPQLIMGNFQGNGEGISQDNKGYISPLEKFQNDSWKILNFRGETLFEVPYNGADPSIKGFKILTSGNHIHRSDVENDNRYWSKTDEIGYKISLRGYDEKYSVKTIGNDGTIRVSLDTSEANHFKIITNGANADIDLLQAPLSNFRRGVTVCFQNDGVSSARIKILNSHIFPESDPAPSTSTQGGRDTELFCYTAGEGNHWLVHDYYINKLTRPGTAVYPTKLVHRFKLFGKAAGTTQINDDLGSTVKINLFNGGVFTPEGLQISASGNKYGISTSLPTVNLNGNISAAVLIKNSSTVEQLASFIAFGTPTSQTNYLRMDNDNDLLRARTVNSNATYDNNTLLTPALNVPVGNDVWTLFLLFKTETGYGVRNLNKFAAGGAIGAYEAFREFPIAGEPPLPQTPVYSSIFNTRFGIGVVPNQTYSSSPTGLGTFVCNIAMIFNNDLDGAEMLQLYKAIRQDNNAVGLSTLPAPQI